MFFSFDFELYQPSVSQKLFTEYLFHVDHLPYSANIFLKQFIVLPCQAVKVNTATSIFVPSLQRSELAQNGITDQVNGQAFVVWSAHHEIMIEIDHTTSEMRHALVDLAMTY